MFGIERKREKLIEQSKKHAEAIRAKFLVLVYDAWDQSVTPRFESFAGTYQEAMLIHAPLNTLKYCVGVWDTRPQPKDETYEG